MICPRCGTPTAAGRRFCAECASPLARTCSGCGFSSEPAMMVCGRCRTALGVCAATSGPRVGPLAWYTPKHLAEKIPPLAARSRASASG